MIKLNKSYIRRKEMDSVLTSMVEDHPNHRFELEKSIKKILNIQDVVLFRSISESFKILVSQFQLQDEGEIIISALTPVSVYNIIKEKGFIPVVVDVDPLTGLLDVNCVNKKINNRTQYIVNYSHYVTPLYDSDLYESGIPVIDILTNGFGEDSNGEYKIISLENDTLISSMGGAALACDNTEVITNIKEFSRISENIYLSDLNSSFALSQIEDLKILKDKKGQIVSLYKNATMKSGYSTLENRDINLYRKFPVVLKRSLKEVQKYCKGQGIETLKAFEDSIVRQIDDIKCKNANSLSNKTLLFPVYLGISKDSIELILKVLSTLP